MARTGSREQNPEPSWRARQARQEQQHAPTCQPLCNPKVTTHLIKWHHLGQM